MMGLIGPLFLTFPGSVDPDTAKGRVAVYHIAVEDIPVSIIKQAVTDFIKGNVPEHDKRFIPTPPQLAEHARKLRKKDEIPLGLLDFTDPEVINDPEIIRRRREEHEFAMRRM